MLVDHQFVTGAQLPELPPCLYQYLVGENGIFVRAERPGLSAVIPYAYTQDIRGLQPVIPQVTLSAGRVPQDLLISMLQWARNMAPQEILFYLIPPDGQYRWRLAVPHQTISGGACRPCDPYHPWGRAALIEVHSHHSMTAFFSGTDNHDEATGFRLYGVLGEINRRPAMRLRVGIYGHFWEIQAGDYFDLPMGMRDAVLEDEYREAHYAAQYAG